MPADFTKPISPAPYLTVNNAHRESMKIRYFCHRSREGSRRTSALYGGTHSACAFGTAHGSPPVPNESPVRKVCTPEKAILSHVTRLPSFGFCAGASVHGTDAAMVLNKRDDVLFVLAELAWCHRQACD